MTFSGVSISGATPSLRRTVYHLMHTILTLERAPHDTQLRVHFVSLPHMHYLNSTYKGVHRPTDVLTFTPAGAADSFVNDLLFGEAEDDSELHHDCSCASMEGSAMEQVLETASPCTAELAASRSCVESLSRAAVRAELVELGDIFVSLNYLQKRCHAAPLRSLPLAPYLHAAMVHATLHALGYDHATPQELQKMVRREQQLGHQIAVLARRCPGYLPPLDVWDTHQQEQASLARRAIE